MSKMRLFEVARMLNMSNQNLIEKLKTLNIEAKSHLTVLNAETTDEILKYFRKENSDSLPKGSVIRRGRRGGQ